MARRVAEPTIQNYQQADAFLGGRKRKGLKMSRTYLERSMVTPARIYLYAFGTAIALYDPDAVRVVPTANGGQRWIASRLSRYTPASFRKRYNRLQFYSQNESWINAFSDHNLINEAFIRHGINYYFAPVNGPMTRKQFEAFTLLAEF